MLDGIGLVICSDPAAYQSGIGFIESQSGDIIKGQLSFAQYFSGPGWVGDLQFLDAPMAIC